MLRRAPIAYLLAVLMDMCMMATTFFAVPRRAAEAGATSIDLGWLSAAFFIPYALISPLSGKMSDRFGRKRFMTLGLLIAGGLIWCYIPGHTLAASIMLSAGMGVAAAIFWPSLLAWLSEGCCGMALASVLGIYCVCWNGGLAIGSSTSGLLYEQNPQLSFMVFGSIILMANVLLLIPTRKPDDLAEGSFTPNHRPTALYHMRAAWLANLVTLLGSGAVTGLFAQLATHLNIRPEVHGNMFMASRLAAVSAFLWMRYSPVWHHRDWPLLASCVLGGLGALIIALASSVPWFFVGFIAIGFITGVTYLAAICYSLEAFEGKAVGAGWSEMILGIGLFAGPLAAGFVGDCWGLRAPYWFAVVLFSVGFLAQVILRITTKPNPDQTVRADRTNRTKQSFS